MKPTVDSRSNSLATASSVALLCLYLLSCGLGTEVGNGAKDEGKTGKKATEANDNSGSNSAGDEKSTRESLESADVDAAVEGVDYGIDLGILTDK